MQNFLINVGTHFSVAKTLCRLSADLSEFFRHNFSNRSKLLLPIGVDHIRPTAKPTVTSLVAKANLC